MKDMQNRMSHEKQESMIYYKIYDDIKLNLITMENKSNHINGGTLHMSIHLCLHRCVIYVTTPNETANYRWILSLNMTIISF